MCNIVMMGSRCRKNNITRVFFRLVASEKMSNRLKNGLLSASNDKFKVVTCKKKWDHLDLKTCLKTGPKNSISIRKNLLRLHTIIVTYEMKNSVEYCAVPGAQHICPDRVPPHPYCSFEAPRPHYRAPGAQEHPQPTRYEVFTRGRAYLNHERSSF